MSTGLCYNNNMNNNKNLRKGTEVKYDGRSQGAQQGTITHVSRIPSFYGNADLVYYRITGADLLVPAADILEVL